MLLKSLVIIGAITGLTLGAVGTLVPWLFPSVFTNNQMVVQQVCYIALDFLYSILASPLVSIIEFCL
jgi:hypothetical protein